MNVDTFNQQYGYQLQENANNAHNARNSRYSGVFPYFDINFAQNIPIPDNDLKKHFKCCGYSLIQNGRPITLLYFQNGFITFYPVLSNALVLSFQFSGCYMAKFCFRGSFYVCHIYCQNDNTDQKRFWNNFVDKYGPELRNLVVFKPTKVYDAVRFRRTFEVGGMIEPNNVCSSLILKEYVAIEPFQLIQVAPERRGMIPISQ